MSLAQRLHSRHRFCVAPMIDWTDRYCRYFHRQLTTHSLLYTEMIVDDAILKGDRERLLDFDAAEHPLALQIGGSDPNKLAAASVIGAEWGYDEINLNVGCPSDRVQSGRFGACLMREPDLVARCVAAMVDAVDVPVTVKCRIGVDDQDPAEVLPDFIARVVDAGAGTVIVHARKAWLDGLSPKENRTIPPLDYDLVRRVAMSHPEASFVLNGGLANPEVAHHEGEGLAGVMLGRAAYERPYDLSRVDGVFFGDDRTPPSRRAVIDQVTCHFDELGVPLWRYARHMLGLFHGRPRARLWRQRISTDARAPEVDGRWLRALADDVLREQEDA